MLLLNNRPIDFFTFSGGEYQVKIPTDIPEERVILTWKPTKPEDITFLLLTVNALKNSGIIDIDLEVLYLPYARQDRVCSPGEANGLQAICAIIDSLGVSTIRLWDVHNKRLTLERFNTEEVFNISAADILARYKVLYDFDLDNLIICAPDEGALDRADEVCQRFDIYCPITLRKVRDPDTGTILGMKWYEFNRDIDGWNILIIDDICDGGATFIEAAKILKEQGAANLYLYVTHGIFSKGFSELSEHYKHIYCHHILHDDKYQSNELLTILREFPFVS